VSRASYREPSCRRAFVEAASRRGSNQRREAWIAQAKGGRSPDRKRVAGQPWFSPVFAGTSSTGQEFSNQAAAHIAQFPPSRLCAVAGSPGSVKSPGLCFLPLAELWERPSSPSVNYVCGPTPGPQQAAARAPRKTSRGSWLRCPGVAASGVPFLRACIAQPLAHRVTVKRQHHWN
jgi:hypothetical protein